MSAEIPLNISIAPFPEGFQGDMDQTFQQAVQLMEAFVEGSFLTGLILPPGSTLPTSDQGPIAMGGVWYFWNPATGHYEAQVVSSKPAKNFVKNPIYQVQQTGTNFTISSTGYTKTYDLTQTRATVGSVLAVAPDVGPAAGADNDNLLFAIKYTVGPSVQTTIAAGDIFAHEHLIEGCDLVMLQGETLSLSFSVWTNTPGTYSVYLANGAKDASYTANFTVPTPSTWTRIKINGIPAFPTAMGTWGSNFSEGVTGLYIGIAMAVGSTFRTATLNTWQSGLWMGSASNINMVGVSNNQLKISGVKLEASSAATFCAAPSFTADYEECIRYYFTTFNYQSVTGGIPIQGAAHLANNAFFSTLFPRRMCKGPTVVPYGWSTFTAGKISNISTSVDYSVATIPATQKGVAGTPAGLTGAKGDVFAAYITADARLT